MIAQALSLGISKRELLRDYYPDEIAQVLRAAASLRGYEPTEEQQVSVGEFLSM